MLKKSSFCFCLGLMLLFWGLLRAEETGENMIYSGDMEEWNVTLPGSGGWDYWRAAQKVWNFSKNEQGAILTPAIIDQMSEATADGGICQQEKSDVHSGKYAIL